jgi:MFS family permease
VPQPSVLAQRDFRLILVAWGVSMLGDYVALVALTLRVEEATGSSLAVAGLLLASGVPIALLNPLAGWLVDRVETTRLLAGTAFVQALVAAALAFVHSPEATIPLAFLLGCGLAVEAPALFALVPRVVGDRLVGRANGWLEGARYAGLTLGTLLGGVFTAAFGTGIALGLNAVTFVVAAVAALALRSRRPYPAHLLVDATGSLLTAGLRVLWRDNVLRISVMVLVSAIAFSAITNVAEVFYAKDELDAGDIGFGALASSWGLGLVFGAVVIGRRVTAGLAPGAILMGTALTGVALGLAAVAPTLLPALVVFVAGGIGNGTGNVAMRTLIHSRVPGEMHGRAYGAFQGALTGADFFALAVGGPLVSLLGPRGTLVVAGGGTLSVALLTLMRLAGLRSRHHA